MFTCIECSPYGSFLRVIRFVVLKSYSSLRWGTILSGLPTMVTPSISRWKGTSTSENGSGVPSMSVWANTPRNIQYILLSLG